MRPGTQPIVVWRAQRRRSAGTTANAVLRHLSRLNTTARPEGFERALPAIEIVGVAELVEALQAA